MKFEPNKARDILVVLNSIEDKISILFGTSHSEDNMRNHYSNIDDNLYETMHSKFLKFVLNVNKRSSNMAVKGELGRFPISIKAISLCVKYWHNIASGQSPNVLLQEAYFSECKFSSPWVQGIQYLLMNNGMGDIWQEPNCKSSTQVYSLISRRLQDQYIQSWFEHSSKSISKAEVYQIQKVYTLQTT